MTLGSVVSALAGVVSFGGYILLVGGIVAWLNVRTIHVPAISVVADMPRNELFGLGLETLGVWLLLGLIIAVAITFMRATVRSNPLLPLGMLVVSTVIGGMFAGVWQVNSLALSVVGSGILVALVVFLVSNTRLHDAPDEPLSVGVATIAGASLGVALELVLVNPGQIAGLMAALLALVFLVWSAIEMFWRREVAQEARYVIDGESFIQWMQLDPNFNRASLLQSSRRRSIAAVVLLAAVLAWGAIASRTSHAFWAARVTMTNGTCVSGTLLVRTSNEVLLAFLERKTTGSELDGGLVEIPSSVISNVQVIGPPSEPRQIQAESCAKAVRNTSAGPFEPYPLVGESSAAEVNPAVEAVPGLEGKEGKRGPEGERGPEGKEGKRGPEGESGVAGKTGAQGKRGAPGRRGERGPRGPRGPRGLSGNGMS